MFKLFFFSGFSIRMFRCVHLGCLVMMLIPAEILSMPTFIGMYSQKCCIKLISHYYTLITSLWPNDAIRLHKYLSTLFWEMACCLTTPRYYMSRCWHIIDGVQWHHYCDVIMNTMASQITSLTVIYSTVYSGADKREHQSSASLVFVGGTLRWPVNFPHKGPVTRKMFPFDDVIMFIYDQFHGKCPGYQSANLVSRLYL